MKQEGHSIWNYIDDFLCVALPSKINGTFNRLQTHLAELGLSISIKKLVPPSTNVTCLGIIVDTVELSTYIPIKKLQVIKEMCKQWSNKSVCTKKELQSLLGSLLYVAKCVKYAKFFLNRMLTLLCENTKTKIIEITRVFKQDLSWFQQFLTMFNGVSFFNYTPSKSVHLDACPTGLGAIFDTQVYAMTLPGSWLNMNIAYTEMINILVALKVWHKKWSGHKVLVKCGNQAVVSVLSTVKTRDSTLSKYARNIFVWLSIMAVHVPGKLNPVADLLSRWNITANNFSKLQQLVPPVTWVTAPQDLLYCDDSI